MCGKDRAIRKDDDDDDDNFFSGVVAYGATRRC